MHSGAESRVVAGTAVSPGRVQAQMPALVHCVQHWAAHTEPALLGMLSSRSKLEMQSLAIGFFWHVRCQNDFLV